MVIGQRRGRNRESADKSPVRGFGDGDSGDRVRGEEEESEESREKKPGVVIVGKRSHVRGL